MLPQEIYLHFNFIALEEFENRYEMRMEESRELVPEEMKGCASIVLDGFCNPVELLHFSIKDKPLYLKLYRRRWKESGSTTHFSNHYNLHPEGAKTMHEFAAFLKGENGCTEDEYLGFFSCS
jgi:hypothetical protein